MSSTCDDSVFDFDFSSLQVNPHSTEIENRIEKQRKNILLLKKKTIHIDTAVKKIISSNQKLEELEKKLSALSEEKKQICIDYNNALDKTMKLEKYAEYYQRHIADLQGKLDVSETQCRAIQSHANQLQQLVQDCETQIESLKIEKELTKVNTKEINTQSQKSKFDCYLQDLCLFRDILLGKKNLQSHHKKILKKYEKFNLNSDADGSASDCSVCDIEDVYNDSTPSLISTTVLLPKTRTLQNSHSFTANEPEKNLHNDDLTNKTRDADHDSDSNNEVVSEDTGRGSSLASSDIEKCLNSPEYFTTNSPFSNGMINYKKSYTNTSTSPITVQIERSDACTSPLLIPNKISDINAGYTQKQTKDIGIQVYINNIIDNRNVSTSPIKIIVHERATSPFKIIQAFRPIEKNTAENAANPVLKTLQDKSKLPMKNIQEKGNSSFELNQNNSNILTRSNEKESLEIANCEVCDDNQNSDCEVEHILRSVRLDYNLITPIPKSPAKQCMHDNIQPSEEYTCSDAAKLAKKVEKLNFNFDALSNIVSILKEKNTNSICNKNNMPIKNHENDLAKSKENCKSFESPLKNSAMKLNIISSPKAQDFELFSEIDEAQNENQINNNKSDDRMIIQEYVVKSPIKVRDKIKKTKKLTRLEKLRKKLLPRGKISRALTPPIRKISRRNPLLFKKKILEKSILEQNSKTAYENAVKVMAEIRSKEKNKSANSAQSKDAVNKMITQEVHIVLSKCDEPVVQNKMTVSTAGSDKTPAFIKSSEKPNTANKSVCNVQSNTTKMSVNKASTNKDDSSAPLILRRSKRLSSSASNNSDTSNRNMLKTEEELITNEVQSCKRLKSVASETLEGPCKKILKVLKPSVTSNEDNTENVNNSPNNKISKPIEYRRRSARLSNTQKNEFQIEKDWTNHDSAKVVIYNDLDMFSEQISHPQICQNSSSEVTSNIMDNMLCKMVKKNAKAKVKWSVKKLPEKVMNSMCKKLEDVIEKIQSSPNNAKETMNNYSQDLRRCNIKIFLAGLMKYLMDPARKCELYNKSSILHSPPMTKSERALIHILENLRYFWRNVDLFDIVLKHIEYNLLQLHHTPMFGVVESMSHFFAVLCRYLRRLTSLRLFIVNAMYCAQFKCIAMIKQATDVWMHILPLAHMGMAKSPIVICLVYLMHFFKCEDKYNRVQEMRTILSRKYFYKIYEWSESDILEMLQNAVEDLSDNKMENKMLQMALVIFAKRKGPQWCQKHIVNNMLLPLIRKHDVRIKIKEFCISVLGRVLKPYPSVMKFQSESVFNELLAMLEKDVTPTLKEAILSGLLYMRHNPDRVNHILFKWNPGSVSSEFEKLLADYVKEKPAHVWKTIIQKIASNMDKYQDFVN